MAKFKCGEEQIGTNADGTPIMADVLCDTPETAEKKADRVAKKKKLKKGKRKNKQPEIHFDEQAFLLDNIKTIKNWEPEFIPGSAKTEKYLYRHFLQIHDDHPNITMNKLQGQGLDALNDITTAQMSGLVPRFRLFKQVVVEGKTITTEFPFDKFSTMDDILDSREGRGTSAGMVSLDWKDTGGTPGTEGKSFRGKIKVRFQSIEAIFLEMNINGQKISYADLLEQAGSLRNYDPKGLTGEPSPGDTSKSPEAAETNNEVQASLMCNETEVGIILEAGWAVNDSTLLNFSVNNLDEQLDDLRKRWVLTIDKFEIMVTENGDIDLDIYFFSRIEGRAISTQSDILNIDETNPFNNPKDIELAMLEMQKTQEAIGGGAEAERLLQKEQKEKKSKSNAKRIKRIREQREKLREVLKTQRSQIDTLAYRRVLARIRQSMKTRGSGGDNRVFYFDLTPEQIKLYTDLLKLYAMKPTFKEKSTKEREKEIVEQYQQDRIEANRAWKRAAPKRTGSTPGDKAWAFTKMLSGLSEKAAKNKKELTKAGMTTTGYLQKVDGNYRLQYIFLGDIVEAVMSLIYEPRNLIGNKLGAGGVRCKYQRKGLKLLLGSFVFVDPWDPDKEILMAIADIPVSLNYFNAWWFDSVVGKNRKNYMLRSFLQDLCGKLINNLMSPQRYGGMPGFALMFSHIPLVLRDGSPLDTEWDKAASKPKERIDISTLLPGGRHARQEGRQNTYSEWLYVYAVGNPKTIRRQSGWQPLGWADKDEKVNIPHFMIGANTGMLKNVTFKRTNIPGQTEVALAKTPKGNESKKVRANLIFQNRYDATIKLFGHPAFKIGQWVYLDTRSMGISAEEKTGQVNIGGYYRITQINNVSNPGMFETTLKGVQEVGIKQIRNMRMQIGKGTPETVNRTN